MKIKNKYLDFIKFLFAKIFKKEYNINMIEEQDKETIKNLYYEDIKDIEEIQKLFNNKYSYEEIRNYVLSLID